MNKLLSIIIPAYNAEKTILSCINSIPKNEKIEIIVINDKSTDNIDKVVHSVEREINYYTLKENMGVSYCRNYGIKQSQAKYITFLDADDTLVKNNLNDVIGLCHEQVFDLLILYYICNPNKNKETYCLFEKNTINLINKVSLLDHYLSNPVRNSPLNYCWAKIYNRDLLINKNILFNENLKINEDIEFVSNVIIKSNSIYSYHKKIYVYNIGQNHSSNNNYSDFNVYKSISYNYYDLIKNKNLIENSLEKFLIMIIHEYLCKKKFSHLRKLLSNEFLIVKNIKKSNIKSKKIKVLFLLKINKSINLLYISLRLLRNEIC